MFLVFVAPALLPVGREGNTFDFRKRLWTAGALACAG